MWSTFRRLIPLIPLAGYCAYRSLYATCQAPAPAPAPASTPEVSDRFASLTYPANDPIEDRVTVESLPALDCVYASVFDGHGGWQISNFLNQHMSATFQLAYQATQGLDQKQRVAVALKNSFDQLEARIVLMAKEPYKMGYGHVASTGSCAITAVVLKTFFVVANAGDCQAIVVNVSENKVTGENICHVHSSNDLGEQEKLRTLHPGEKDIVVCKHPKACYVKGRLMPTRSFGDLDLKSVEFNNPQNLPKHQGFKPPKKQFSGPYITHEPDVQIRDIRSTDKFLILASDGLWDEISEQEAAELVAKIDAPKDAAVALFREALDRACKKAGITVEKVMHMPEGRRKIHDDISIAVIPLK